MNRVISLLALTLAAGLLGGCVARGPSLQIALQKEDARLWKDARRDRLDGASTARLAAVEYLLFNDPTSETDLLQLALEMAPEDPAVRWRAARTASRERRFADLLANALALLEIDPDGPGTELAWGLIDGNRADVPGLPDALDQLLASGDPADLSGNPATRDLLLQLAEQRLAERGERDAAIEMLKRRGFVTNWTIAGPAGNDPLGEFRDGPALDRAEGQPVVLILPYIPLQPSRPGGGVYEGWADVEIERRGRYLVTAASTASILLDLDGERLLEQDRWTRFTDRTRHAAVTLDAGSHSLHVRVASDMTYSTMAIQVVPLTAEDPDQPPRTDLDVVPGGAIDELRQQLAAHPEDPELVLDLVLAKTLDGVDFRGRMQALELAEELPLCAEASRRAGLAILADSALAESTRDEIGLPLIKHALQLDPELVGLTVMLAGRYSNQDPESARNTLMDVVERRPDFVRGHLELAESYKNLSWHTEAEDALLATLALGPKRTDLLEHTHAFYSTRGEVDSAQIYRQRQLDAIGTPFSRERAQILDDLGRLNDAADELEQLNELDPHDPSAWKERIRVARALGDRDRVRDLLLEASALFPGDPWPQQQLSMLAMADGDQEQALAWLDEALQIDPANLELRQRRWRLAGDVASWLSGDPEPPEYDPANPDEVVRQAIAAFEADPGETADYATVVLLDRQEVQVFAGGASVFRMHRLVRLQDRPAVDAYAELAPGAMEVISARTWRTDGTAVDADPPEEKDAYAMRDLTPGCTIDLQAIIAGQSDLGGEDGAHVGPVFIGGSYSEFTRRSELIYLLPPGAEYVLRGTAPEPEISPTPDGGLRLRWLEEDVAPFNPQPMSPMAEEYVPWVQVVIWTDLEETLAPERSAQLWSIRPDPMVDELAAMLDTDDVPSVVRAVRESIRPPADYAEQAADVVDILATGTGSYETVVLALLEAAGVEVDRVLARPRYLPDLGDTPRLATDYAWSLLRVVGEDGDLWLDLTDPYVPIGWLHPVLRDAEIVAVGPVDSPLPDRTPAPSGRLPGLDVVGELTVDEQGNAAGVLRLGFFRQADGLLREELWNVAAADRQQTFEGWLSQALPGASVLAVEAVNLNDSEGPAVIDLTVEIPGLFQDDDGALAAPIFFPDLLPPTDGQARDLSSLVMGGPRTSPLLVWPYHESLELRLSGPGVAGRDIRGWDPLSIRTDLLEVTRGREWRKKTLVLTRETTMRLGRVQPELYPELRDLVTTAVASGRTPVVLQP